ncbi:hypothetical protein ACFZAD_21055 [Streptomyces iakyrus]|uniref:hypothetical protein n=1 Tax=Streptomyces iakyrus TaxID=68219 RepID=UPI0036EA2FF8
MNAELRSAVRAADDAFRHLEQALAGVGDRQVESFRTLVQLDEPLNALTSCAGRIRALLEVSGFDPALHEHYEERTRRLEAVSEGLANLRALSATWREREAELIAEEAEHQRLTAEKAEFDRRARLVGELPTLRGTVERLRQAEAAARAAERELRERTARLARPVEAALAGEPTDVDGETGHQADTSVGSTDDKERPTTPVGQPVALDDQQEQPSEASEPHQPNPFDVRQESDESQASEVPQKPDSPLAALESLRSAAQDWSSAATRLMNVLTPAVADVFKRAQLLQEQLAAQYTALRDAEAHIDHVTARLEATAARQRAAVHRTELGCAALGLHVEADRELARALGIAVPEPDISRVEAVLNRLRQALDGIDKALRAHHAARQQHSLFLRLGDTVEPADGGPPSGGRPTPRQ